MWSGGVAAGAAGAWARTSGVWRGRVCVCVSCACVCACVCVRAFVRVVEREGDLRDGREHEAVELYELMCFDAGPGFFWG